MVDSMCINTEKYESNRTGGVKVKRIVDFDIITFKYCLWNKWL